MERPKGNDVRRAVLDGPPEIAAFFRNGRLETIPAGRDRRQAVRSLRRPICRRPRLLGDEVNRILQAVHSDHATVLAFSSTRGC